MNDRMVSIIVPMYNASDFIIETLNSIKNQTYKNYEIILIDDCSTDNTVELVQNFNSDKIKLYKLEKNLGAAETRNYGIKQAKGRYLAFLDSDDTWHKDKLEKQIAFMKKNDYCFTFTSLNITDKEGKIIKKSRKISKEVKYSTLLKNTLIATSSVIIDINFYGKFLMPNIRSGQDYATWLMLLRENNKAYGLNEPLLNYRRNKSSLSSNKLTNFKKVYFIQTSIEGISKFNASVNILFYLFHAIKKHFL